MADNVATLETLQKDQQTTAEQIAKSDRCQALSYAMQACGHMGDGDHIVNVAKILEAYLKGEVMGSGC